PVQPDARRFSQRGGRRTLGPARQALDSAGEEVARRAKPQWASRSDQSMLSVRRSPKKAGVALRILAIHAGMHDSSAAAFDEYRLVAAASEERFTRVKGQGESIPWLAIDEVLRTAGWRRNDIDAIATTRGWFPTYHDRFSLPRELYYT